MVHVLKRSNVILKTVNLVHLIMFVRNVQLVIYITTNVKKHVLEDIGVIKEFVNNVTQVVDHVMDPYLLNV